MNNFFAILFFAECSDLYYNCHCRNNYRRNHCIRIITKISQYSLNYIGKINVKVFLLKEKYRQEKLFAILKTYFFTPRGIWNHS